MNKHTPQWYVANMGNDHQGLVVDEATGRNIAVAYDRKDTPMLAAAPAMYEALHDLVTAHETGMKGSALALRVKIARDVLAQADGKQ